MRGRLLSAIGLVLFLAGGGAAAAADDGLARARQLYNERRFEAAVLAAEEARTPERSDSVDLITARAFLERFRESASVDDLTTARERLRRLNPDRLNPGERVEYLVGLGEHLFLDGLPGAAANIFDNVLTSAPALSTQSRERVLDWWAHALDLEARPLGELDRHPFYQRVRERMRDELSMNPASAVAPFWLAAAASGQGDQRAAWDAALAAWVRAPLNDDRGGELRSQLDRLVLEVIVPQRARAQAQSPEVFQQEWEAFKSRWSR